LNAEELNNVQKKAKRSLLKEMKSGIKAIEIRSLILGCVFETLDSNNDLSNYIFNTRTIQMHRLTKDYLKSKKLKEESIKNLPEFIDPELKYLL
jgi:hypothetical protein